jgi:MoaA/NifB/PqqE/SkfB family radical SAM enzyme
MKHRAIFTAWGRILQGGSPFLAIEITKECPLKCPGCYAFAPDHLNGELLKTLSDSKGQDLVDGVLAVVREKRPLHVSLVGGEPLVRHRELDKLIPQLIDMGVEVQIVTSAVREIPKHWAEWDDLHVVVSVDGLQPDHDRRRAPATYERILKNIEGHKIIVHCTVTRAQSNGNGYLREFSDFWSKRPEAYKIWFSLFTPQELELSGERLTPAERSGALDKLEALRPDFPKVYLPDVVINGYRKPPDSPEDCIFAQTTECLSSDLSTVVTPCQLGGRPVCSECGCMAAAGMTAIGRYKVGGLVKAGDIFNASRTFGKRWGNGNGKAKHDST